MSPSAITEGTSCSEFRFRPLACASYASPAPRHNEFPTRADPARSAGSPTAQRPRSGRYRRKRQHADSVPLSFRFCEEARPLPDLPIPTFGDSLAGTPSFSRTSAKRVGNDDHRVAPANRSIQGSERSPTRVNDRGIPPFKKRMVLPRRPHMCVLHVIICKP
jgi:hypothetical protein